MKEQMVKMSAVEAIVAKAVAEALANQKAVVTPSVAVPVAPVKTMTELEFVYKAVDKLHNETYHGVNRVYDLTEPYRKAVEEGVIVGEKVGLLGALNRLVEQGKIHQGRNKNQFQTIERYNVWASANGKAPKISKKAENSLKLIVG